jgi:hypothetical protein
VADFCVSHSFDGKVSCRQQFSEIRFSIPNQEFVCVTYAAVSCDALEILACVTEIETCQATNTIPK